MTFPEFNLLVVCLAGWLTQQQNRVIDFLMEENRTLHELLGEKRLRRKDQQRRRLTEKDRPISRKILDQICTLVTPDMCCDAIRFAPKRSITVGAPKARLLASA